MEMERNRWDPAEENFGLQKEWQTVQGKVFFIVIQVVQSSKPGHYQGQVAHQARGRQVVPVAKSDG